MPAGQGDRGDAIADGIHLHGQKVGFTDEIGHEAIDRGFIDVARGADLLDVALGHDGDAV